MVPTNGNGGGLLLGLPMWARIATIIGVPGVISLYLVWWVSSAVASDMKMLKSQHENNSRYLAQICRNTATNQEDRRSCDRVEDSR